MPLLWLSAAFIIGIVLGKYTALPMLTRGIAGGLFLFLLISDRFLQRHLLFWSFLRRRIPLSPGLLLLSLCLGVLLFSLSTPVLTPSDLGWYNDKGEYSFVGHVSAPPDVRSDRILYEIDITELTDSQVQDQSSATRRVNGKALVTMTRWNDWQFGDVLLFSGEPRTPAVYPDFSYQDYLARQRIYSVVYYPSGVQQVGTTKGSALRHGMIAWREKARTTILSLMPQPESGLLAGILLGLENDLPLSLKQAFRDTGTAHIIAISGFNMTIIATLLITLLSRLFNRYWGVVFAIAGIALYTVFVDGSASVVRAAIMVSSAAIGHLIGRRQSGLNALAFTAALLCLFNPQLLWDVSFQLSFMATLGLVLFAQPMQDALTSLVKKRFGPENAVRVASPISEYFLFTLAAQFTTLPVIAL